MKQIELIPGIKRLCNELKHDEAIKLTSLIENKDIANKAHLLCIEHEQRCIIDKKIKDKNHDV